MQINCKLIALDIDGTLLDDRKKIPDEVRQSLQRARETGIRIALLSGRMPYAVELIEKELGFPCIKACNAGTCVILDSGEMLMEFIDAKTAKAVFHEVAEKYQMPLWMYRGREWIVTSADRYVEQESRIIARSPVILDMDLLCKRWESLKTGPNKLLFGADPEVITQIAGDMEAYRTQKLDFARSADMYLEVYRLGANKGKALRTICEALKISTENVMAFGDQELDLPMLTEAGYAVAMGNAIPLLKQHANFVTASNNDAGVAYAMKVLLHL